MHACTQAGTPHGDGVRALVHVERRADAVPRAVAVVQAHGPQWGAREGIQCEARGARRKHGPVQRDVALAQERGTLGSTSIMWEDFPDNQQQVHGANAALCHPHLAFLPT